MFVSPRIIVITTISGTGGHTSKGMESEAGTRTGRRKQVKIIKQARLT
jgi:hypothetical protein